MDLKRKVEAVLFASGRKMSVAEIAKLVKAPDVMVKDTLQELSEDLAKEDSSLLLSQESEDWRLTVREEHLDLVKDLVPTTELPKAVTETLAVIAYKQPVLQSTVVRIRGNKAYDHIEVLIEQELITKEKQGRSFQLKITPKFLEYFELPTGGNVKEALEEKLKGKGVEIQDVPDEPEDAQAALAESPTEEGLPTYGEKPQEALPVSDGEEASEHLGRLEVYGEEEQPEKKEHEHQEHHEKKEAEKAEEKKEKKTPAAEPPAAPRAQPSPQEPNVPILDPEEHDHASTE